MTLKQVLIQVRKYFLQEGNIFSLANKPLDHVSEYLTKQKFAAALLNHLASKLLAYGRNYAKEQ